MPRPALATAATTSVDLYPTTGAATPAQGNDGPSREEVQQRINNLYDQAESVSGNYNATRAMSAGRPREGARALPDAGRGRADAGRGRGGKAAATDATLSDRAKQWFDVGRSQLGPLLPAVLPPDRTSADGRSGTRPTIPAGRPGDRSADRAPQAAGKPVLELTAGPGAAAAARPVAELTAGPGAALPALPAPREAAAEVLPAVAAEPRQSLKTSKQRSQSKLAKARELLAGHIARRDASLTALVPSPAPAPVENAWPTASLSASASASAQNYSRPAAAEWWQPQPQSAGLGMELPVGSMGPDLTLGTGLSAGPDLTFGMNLPVGPDLTLGMDQPMSPGLAFGGDQSLGAGLPLGSIASDQGYGGKAAKAVDFAREQIGKPCVWGAMGPGSYDCSSLMQAAWKTAGVVLPRTVHDQATAGTVVSLADIRLGDLVVFHGHVAHIGIYSGNGMMVHAPNPGAVIREESIHWAGETAIHSVVRPA